MNDIKKTDQTVESSPKKRVQRVVFWSIVLLFLIVSTIGVIDALRWVNKPFAGFLLNKRLAIANTGRDHWTGIQAGLKYPDKIIAAERKAVGETNSSATRC